MRGSIRLIKKMPGNSIEAKHSRIKTQSSRVFLLTFLLPFYEFTIRGRKLLYNDIILKAAKMQSQEFLLKSIETGY